MITATAACPTLSFKSSTASLVIDAVMIGATDIDLDRRHGLALGHLDDLAFQLIAGDEFHLSAKWLGPIEQTSFRAWTTGCR